MKNMKRVICWIITVMLIINMLPFAALAADGDGQVNIDQTNTAQPFTFKVGEVSVPVRADAQEPYTVEVPVSIANNTGFMGSQFYIRYDDDNLELLEISEVKEFPSQAHDPESEGNETPSTLVVSHKATTGFVMLDSAKIVEGNGELLKLTFKIKNPTQTGNYWISIEVDELYGGDFKELKREVVRGSVTVGVAQIGEKTYTSIAEAIAAAKDGDTVTIFAGEFDPINISYKNITIQGTVGANGELLTTIKGGNPAITGHGFNGTIKDLKIVDAFKVMYAEPAGNVTVDNVYVTGATYGLHLVAYSNGLTWTIQNSYMDLSWANSFGTYGGGDAAIVVKSNEFASTNPYYPDYGALAVNTFLPNVTVEENIFGENVKIFIDDSVTDTSNIVVTKNYHADGVDKAFAVDEDGGLKVDIKQYYKNVDGNGNLTDLVTLFLTYEEFNEFVRNAAGGVYNGAGITVVLKDSERSYQNNKTAQFFIGATNVNITNPVETVKVSNINFVFVDDVADNYLSGELQVFAKYIEFTNCTFNNVAVSPWGMSNSENPESAVFTYCEWNDLIGRYGVHQNRASNLTVTGCTFTNCERGIHTNSSTVSSITITGNTFTGIGDNYGVLCLAEGNGDLSNATLNISGNNAEGQTMLRQLSSTLTYDQVSAILDTTKNTYGTAYVYGSIEPAIPVAQIGSVKYVTLADALAAAQAGDTITLLADIEASEVILIKKSITINGNGHTVTSSARRIINVIEMSNCEVTIKDLKLVSTAERVGTNDIRGINVYECDNVTLNIDNCSVDFRDASATDWSYAINVCSDVNNSTLSVNGGTYKGANVINAYGANNTIVVKYATLTSLYPNNDQYYGACIWVLQNQGSSVEATGNTFNGANAVAFNVGSGTTVTESNNTDNTTTVVAKIGDTYYTSITEAIKNITDGSTLTIFEGTYDAALVISKSNVTVIGIGNVTLNGVPSIKGTNYKVENIDFVYSTGSGNLSGSGLIKDCTFTATATNGNTFRYCYGTKDATITFENCAINAPNGWAIHFDSAPGMKLIFTGCEINGRVALGGDLGSLTATGTIFKNGYVNVWGTVSGATFNTCDFVDVPYIFTGSDEDNTFYFNDCDVTVNGETKSVTDIIYGGNDAAEAEIYVDNVLKSGAAKIGNTYYKTLVEALAAAQDNDTITLLADATPALTSQRAITKAAVIDLNDYTLTLTQGDLYFGTTTFQNGKIVVDPSVKASTAVFWMFENQTLTFDKVDLVATGVTGTYLIGINGGSGTAVNILNSSITINNAATTALTAVICDNGKGNSVVIDKSDIDVKNIEGRFYLGGTNGTVTVNDSDLDLNGVKEGFYIRAGQHLTISGTSTVDIALNSSEGRYGINVTDLTATYTKAETATVNSTVYEPSFEATINGKKYATFAKALAAAQAGDTIELLADVTASEVILIEKSITINGNGHKVTSSATRVFRVTTSGVEVTLNKVNMVSTAVRVGTNDIRGISIDTVDNVTLTLNNCSVDFTDASANDWTYAVNVTGGKENTVTVNGGTYEGANVINVRGASQTVVVKDATLTSLYPDNDVYYGACIYVVQNENSSVTATGNIFNGANAVAINVGYTPVTESNNTDNTTRVVAKVGDTYYTSLEDAFKAATSGCTIKILANVTVDGKWDCRYTGSKFTVPVTIDGNGKTITFTNTVYDGGNYMSAFRFEADATVINLTIDMSEALSGFAGRFRAISAKANLTVDGCTFIGNGSANNTRAIIFGEGAGNADAVISITNSTFIGWRRGISDSESGKDVAETIVITGNTLNDASVYVSASEKITFNNNTASGEVDLRSYAAENVLSVEAQGNTLNTNVKNYIYAKTIEAQAEFTTKNPPIKVSTKAELNAALAAAKDGDIIVLTADIDYGTDQLAITKAITLDLGGKTLTTRNAYGGMSVKGNPTIKNGTIVHASNTAAIKVWNATAFEDLVIDVQGKGDANKTIGGIVLQSGSTTRVGSIKNVTIKGAALTNGIETYNCGDATENVIGSMEKVTIDAQGTGMLISAPCGTATDCSISGGVNGIEIWIKGNYSASLDLVNSTVEGGVYAHDEFNNNPGVVNNGTLILTVDDATTGAGVEDVTLTLARAENVEGVIKEVKENAQAKVNDTYYATLADAMAAAKAGDIVTVFAGKYAMPSMKAGITIEGAVNNDGTPAVLFEGTLTGTLENLTLKNIHIKGGNAQRWAYAKGDLVFENVTFEATSVYALHFDGITAGATLTYKNCTIIGWAAMSGSPASCVFEGCTFKGNGTYGLIRTYFDATIENCTFDVANVNTNDTYQDGIHAVSGATVTVNNCKNANGDMNAIVNVSGTSVVVLDDVEIKNVAKIGDKYYRTLAEAFAASKDGDTITLLADASMSEEFVVEGRVLTINGNGKLTFNDKLIVRGETTLNISCATVDEVILDNGAILKDSTINGKVFVAGKVIFRGKNTVTMVYDYGTLTDYYGTSANMEWTVEEGSSLTITDKSRYGLGYGDNITIYGSLTDALSARDTLSENDVALFMHGLVAQESNGWNCNSSMTVKDAYVIIGSNNSFGNKPGNYGGSYKFVFENVVLDASRITFYEALSQTAFALKNSDVKTGTFMIRDKDSIFTLTNTKMLSTTTFNGNDEGNYLAGTLVLINSELTYSASIVMEGGTIQMDIASVLNAPSITGNGTIIVDATGINGNAIQLINADMSGFTGTIQVVNAPAIAEITSTGLVIKQAAAKIGDTYYATLQAAIDAVQNGDTIILLADNSETVTIKQVEGVNIVIDGNDKEFSGKFIIHGNSRSNGAETLTFQDINFVTDKAGHYFIDSNSTASAERYAHNVTVTGCTFKATGAAVDSAAAMRIRQGFNIVIEDVTATDLHSVLQAYGNKGVKVTDLTITRGKNGISAGTSTGVVVENAKINATGYGIRADGTGAYDLTVKDSEITANQPIVVRNNTADGYTLTLSGNNELNGEKYDVIITKGDDGEAYVAPEVSITLNGVTNLNPVHQAKIGNTYYATLEDALAAEGDTVILLAPVVIEKGDTVEFDLKGKTITTTISEKLTKSFAMFTNKGNLTITDSVGGGKISLNYTAESFGYGVGLYVISNEGGTLTINGGRIENLTTVTGSMYDAIDNNSTLGDTYLTINGGEIYCAYLGIRQFANSTTYENLVTVNGGKVEGDNSAIWIQNPGSNQPKANVVITGGYIVNRILAGESEGFAVAISGGTFTEKVPSEFCAVGYIPVANDNGTWTVLKGILGDVSGDGALSSKDVVLLRQYVAGFDITIQFNVSLADVNNDGVVSSKDVVKLRQIIVGN